MALFEYLDYPKLPSSLVEDILTTVEKNVSSFKEDALLYADQSILDAVQLPEPDWTNNLGFPLSNSDQDTCKFHFMEAPESVKKWVQENIPVKVNAVHIQTMADGTHIVPHVDEIRNKALNYIISQGGKDVCTNFFVPRNEFSHLTISPQTLIPKDRLELIESICINSNEWHSLKVDKIHNVENITPPDKRISLTLSIVC